VAVMFRLTMRVGLLLVACYRCVLKVLTWLARTVTVSRWMAFQVEWIWQFT
jgi:hypothetical protein